VIQGSASGGGGNRSRAFHHQRSSGEQKAAIAGSRRDESQQPSTVAGAFGRMEVRRQDPGVAELWEAGPSDEVAPRVEKCLKFE
jgi:hypothetical protein